MYRYRLSRVSASSSALYVVSCLSMRVSEPWRPTRNDSTLFAPMRTPAGLVTNRILPLFVKTFQHAAPGEDAVASATSFPLLFREYVVTVLLATSDRGRCSLDTERMSLLFQSRP